LTTKRSGTRNWAVRTVRANHSIPLVCDDSGEQEDVLLGPAHYEDPPLSGKIKEEPVEQRAKGIAGFPPENRSVRHLRSGRPLCGFGLCTKPINMIILHANYDSARKRVTVVTAS